MFVRNVKSPESFTFSFQFVLVTYYGVFEKVIIQTNFEFSDNGFTNGGVNF